MSQKLSNSIIITALLIVSLQLNEIVHGQSDGNNIVFDLADLTVDYQTDNGWISLEAFKSSINDLIIQANDLNKYGQLNWLSIGYPQLVLTPNPTNKSLNQMFIFKPEGFYVRVEMLTNLQRKLFQGVVQRKYNIPISTEQIVNLVPSKFECSMNFYVDSKRILINGKVNQFNTFPLKIEFAAPYTTPERLALEKRIKDDGSNLDLNIDCEINSKGKTYRQNTLIITGNQLYKIGLIDDLFGPATDRYVTRRQMTDLTSEVYLKLNIIEDYQMPESQFKENFINDFIAQAANTTFQSIKIEDALKLLSQYDFKYDLRPDVITQDLGKIFSIKKTGSKEQIIANRTNFENLKTNTRIETDASASGSFIDVFDASASYQYVSDKSFDWTKATSSFDSQLKELNAYNENNFEWQRVGEFVKPKTIKVVKLAKSLMSRNLVFSRVKREYYDAPFKRIVSLNTFNNVNLPSNIQESVQRLIKLENDLIQATSTFQKQIQSNQNNTMENLTTLNKFINEVGYNLNKSIQNNLISIGDIKYSTVLSDHNGWLLCDGRELLKKNFDSLFKVIGITFGGGGSSADSGYFKIPEMGGRSVVSAGAGNGLTSRIMGSTGGAELHTLTINEIPSHSHIISGQDNYAAPSGSASNEVGNVENYPSLYDRKTSSVGGGQSHNNMHPFIVLNSFIYAGV